MRRASWVRPVIIVPVVVAMCADSPAPGCCGSTKPAQGELSCTMVLTAAAPQSLPCAGEWFHWSDDTGNWKFSASGGADGSYARFEVWVGSSAAPGTEFAFGTGLTGSAIATVPSGGYAASANGGEAHLALASLSPPAGTFTAVLVPSATSTTTPGPEGTTVRLDVSF